MFFKRLFELLDIHFVVLSQLVVLLLNRLSQQLQLFLLVKQVVLQLPDIEVLLVSDPLVSGDTSFEFLPPLRLSRSHFAHLVPELVTL